MKFIIYLFIIVTTSISITSAQTYGRLDMSPQIFTPQEAQVLESFEEVFALEEVIDPTSYILGPGDKLGINILISESITLSLTVTPTGDLLIPSVGVIHVAGKTLAETVTAVRDFVKTQTYPNAKVSVALVNLRIFLVQITGAVNRPGFVEVTPVTRLSQVVKQTDDFHQFAREFDITVTNSSGKNQKINFLEFLRKGDLANNPTFLEGDRIRVPFGNVGKEGVVIRGSISGSGYDIIEAGETLESFLRRRAKFSEQADLESVIITRIKNNKEVFLTILPKNFKTTVLKAGDNIDILRERGVMVNGFVQTPGGYAFFPGFAAADYINLAGGNTIEGNPDKVIVRHLDGTMEKGQSVIIRRGDVIVIPRTGKSLLFGNSSALQIITAFLTVFLTFLAI